MLKLPLTVLYAEDDPITLNTVTSILNKRIENVLSASDGVEALRLFYEHKPQIVITDIKMPKLDGIELTRQIKNHSHDVYVIVTTAYEDKEIVSQFYQAGVDYYIIKPISKGKLLDAIDRYAKILGVLNEQV